MSMHLVLEVEVFCPPISIHIHLVNVDRGLRRLPPDSILVYLCWPPCCSNGRQNKTHTRKLQIGVTVARFLMV